MSKKKKNSGKKKHAVQSSASNTTDKKKNKNQGKAPRKQRAGLGEYLKGVRLEMKKVVWPTKSELGSYTVVVVALCSFFALMFWAIDSGFLLALQHLLGITM